MRFVFLATFTLAACGGPDAHDASTTAPTDVAIASVASAPPGVAASAPAVDAAAPAAMADAGAAPPMFTSDSGAEFGTGGLGLSGTGEGGGQGEGIGLGNIGPSIDGGAPRKNAPRIREGAIAVNGRLPPEVVQRIVRQNFGRFRLCYEQGLKQAPTLEGKVVVKFKIDATGSVASASNGGSTLPDSAVVSCVVRAFGNLSFPQPEAGIVVVTYPITFAVQ
jgi:TonB family protein